MLLHQILIQTNNLKGQLQRKTAHTNGIDIKFSAQLMTVANEAGKITLNIMTLYSMIKSELQRFNANDPLAKNINEQLDFLIYTGFIRHTPYTT